MGVSASLGECWVDCTVDVGEYNWALFERTGTETLVLPIGGTFLRENSEGRLAFLVAVPFPEACAFGTLSAAFAAFVMPY